MNNLPFDRHDRAASLLKEVVATFIQQEANTNPMITVTHVTVSPDYRKVTAYITTIPDGREADALIFLKRSASEMRGFVKKKTNLKIIPHLEFAYDYGEKHRQHIDEIAREIDGNKPTEEVIDGLLASGAESHVEPEKIV
jgi:ribosome-binding factor A